MPVHHLVETICSFSSRNSPVGQMFMVYPWFEIRYNNRKIFNSS